MRLQATILERFRKEIVAALATASPEAIFYDLFLQACTTDQFGAFLWLPDELKDAIVDAHPPLATTPWVEASVSTGLFEYTCDTDTRGCFYDNGCRCIFDPRKGWEASLSVESRCERFEFRASIFYQGMVVVHIKVDQTYEPVVLNGNELEMQPNTGEFRICWRHDPSSHSMLVRRLPEILEAAKVPWQMMNYVRDETMSERHLSFCCTPPFDYEVVLPVAKRAREDDAPRPAKRRE